MDAGTGQLSPVISDHDWPACMRGETPVAAYFAERFICTCILAVPSTKPSAMQMLAPSRTLIRCSNFPHFNVPFVGVCSLTTTSKWRGRHGCSGKFTYLPACRAGTCRFHRFPGAQRAASRRWRPARHPAAGGVAAPRPDRANGYSTQCTPHRPVSGDRKRWLGVVAATVLAGGLASIVHRDNATVPPRQSSDRCSGACPCGSM